MVTRRLKHFLLKETYLFLDLGKRDANISRFQTRNVSYFVVLGGRRRSRCAARLSSQLSSAGSSVRARPCGCRPRPRNTRSVAQRGCRPFGRTAVHPRARPCGFRPAPVAKHQVRRPAGAVARGWIVHPRARPCGFRFRLRALPLELPLELFSPWRGVGARCVVPPHLSQFFLCSSF